LFEKKQTGENAPITGKPIENDAFTAIQGKCAASYPAETYIMVIPGVGSVSVPIGVDWEAGLQCVDWRGQCNFWFGGWPFYAGCHQWSDSDEIANQIAWCICSIGFATPD